MAVIEKISVGDIFYYLVDDIPTHSAPKGSVAILSGNDILSSINYINNDGGVIWIKMIKPLYSQMYVSDEPDVNEIDFNNLGIGGWTSFIPTSDAYTTTLLNGFTKGTDGTFGDFLEYTGNTSSPLYLRSPIRVSVKQQSTVRSGTKWMYVGGSPTKNFTPQSDRFNEMYIFSNESTNNLGTVRVSEMVKGDQFTVAWTALGIEGGGGGPGARQILNKHTQLDIYKIDEPFTIINFLEDWESSGFTENSWTVVNDTTNVWIVNNNRFLNGSFENDFTDWNQVDGFNGSSANFTISTGDTAVGSKAAVVEAVTLGTNPFDIQLTQGGFSMDVNETYTLSFWAKSDEPNKTIQTNFIEAAAPNDTYFSANTTITTGWTKYEYTFTPSQTDSNSLFTLDLGNETGTTRVDGFSLINTNKNFNAFISDNTEKPDYTITTANVSHFYKDFVLPLDVDSITLSFDWKCQGENAAGVTQYDYGAVVITTTGTTPVAGTEVTTTQTGGAATTRLGATDNSGKFNLAYGTTPGSIWNTETIDLSDYIGETKRLVFTWKNDGSVGTNPPFIIDNIRIVTNKY
jgi:hypothetical protein